MADLAQSATHRRPTPKRDRVRELYRDGHGLSVREIAAVMHISTQAVYWHLEAIRTEHETATKDVAS
jgi:DNA invertase Pin-like site-specific DNA recombinase